MSESKFTPGPWRMDEIGCIEETSHWKQVAAIMPTNREANGNLIAAAPELYNALVDCIEQIKDLQEDVPDSAKEALAQARGDEKP